MSVESCERRTRNIQIWSDPRNTLSTSPPKSVSIIGSAVHVIHRSFQPTVVGKPRHQIPLLHKIPVLCDNLLQTLNHFLLSKYKQGISNPQKHTSRKWVTQRSKRNRIHTKENMKTKKHYITTHENIRNNITNQHKERLYTQSPRADNERVKHKIWFVHKIIQWSAWVFRSKREYVSERNSNTFPVTSKRWNEEFRKSTAAPRVSDSSCAGGHVVFAYCARSEWVKRNTNLILVIMIHLPLSLVAVPTTTNKNTNHKGF